MCKNLCMNLQRVYNLLQQSPKALGTLTKTIEKQNPLCISLLHATRTPSLLETTLLRLMRHLELLGTWNFSTTAYTFPRKQHYLGGGGGDN